MREICYPNSILSCKQDNFEELIRMRAQIIPDSEIQGYLFYYNY